MNEKLRRIFTFDIRTGNNYIFAAENFKALEKWVTVLTITPMDYIRYEGKMIID